MQKRIFSTAEAAEYIGISESTLRLSRSKAKHAAKLKFVGPPHVQASDGGKVIYMREDLDAWLAANKHDPRGRPRKDRARDAAK